MRERADMSESECRVRVGVDSLLGADPHPVVRANDRAHVGPLPQRGRGCVDPLSRSAGEGGHERKRMPGEGRRRFRVLAPTLTPSFAQTTALTSALSRNAGEGTIFANRLFTNL